MTLKPKLTGLATTAEVETSLGGKLSAPRKSIRSLKQLNLIGQIRSPASVASITRSGATATATMTTAHDFAIGDTVLIAGASQAEYNNGWRILTTPDDNDVYVYPCTRPDASNSGNWHDYGGADCTVLVWCSW